MFAATVIHINCVTQTIDYNSDNNQLILFNAWWLSLLRIRRNVWVENILVALQFGAFATPQTSLA